jgi:ankyrin repeat protein
VATGSESKFSPLFVAAENGHHQAVLQLLSADACADVNIRNGTIGETALGAAAREGHVEIVRTLLEFDADAGTVTFDDGTTPLFSAVCGGHRDVAKTLLTLATNGVVNPNATTADEYGLFPLYVAADDGDAWLVEALLNAGADANLETSDDGTTATFVAAKGGHCAALATLLQHDASPDTAKSSDGRFPLHAAAQHGHFESTVLLLAAGADPSMTLHDGCGLPQLRMDLGLPLTAHAIAMEESHLRVAAILVKAMSMTSEDQKRKFARVKRAIEFSCKNQSCG